MGRNSADDQDEDELPAILRMPAGPKGPPAGPRRLPTGTKTLVGITPVRGAEPSHGRVTVRGMPALSSQDERETPVPATPRPATQLPATQPPAALPPATQLPATQLPATQPPAALPPTTVRSAPPNRPPANRPAAKDRPTARDQPATPAAPATRPAPQSDAAAPRKGRHGEDLVFLTRLRERLLPELQWMPRGARHELLSALSEGRLGRVEEMLDDARRERPRHLEVTAAMNALRDELDEHVRSRLGPPDAVLLRAREPSRPGPAAQRLLANVNGVSTIEDVLVACGLPFIEAVRGLAELCDAGNLFIPGREPAPVSASGRGPNSEASRAHDRSTLPEILAPHLADQLALGEGGASLPADQTPMPVSRRLTLPPAPLSTPPPSGSEVAALERALVAAASAPPPPRSSPPAAAAAARGSSRPPGSGAREGANELSPIPPPPRTPNIEQHAEPGSAASASASSVPPKGASSVPPKGASSAPPKGASSAPPRGPTSSRRDGAMARGAEPRATAAPGWMKVSAAASLLAMLAGGIALYRSGGAPTPTDESAAPPPRSAPSAAPPPPAPTTTAAAPAPTPEAHAVPAATVQIKVRATPHYARVMLDGVLLPPPTEVFLHRRTEPHKLRVEAPGFATQELEVTGERDSEVAVTLQKKAGPRPPPPANSPPPNDDPYR